MTKTTGALMLAAVVTAGCLFGGGKSSNLAPGVISDGKQLVSVITSGPFDVDARGFKQFKIIVPPGATSAQLEGTFTASGGSGDDIEVTLFEETQFLNWQSRNKFLPIYESGRLTADRIKVSLPPDPATYVMVFSNRFSLLSSKGIVADLKLRYEPGKK